MLPTRRPIWADDTQKYLPKNQRRVTNRTEFARKYGHPVGTIDGVSQRIFKNTGKSGGTPIQETGTQNDRVLESYQKRRFNGFSSNELSTLDALASVQKQQMNGNLNNPISPLYARSQWETFDLMPKNLGPIPIRGDHEGGYWLADNPVVWKAMLPSLQLASLFIENANFFPWWDALLNNEIINIPDARDPRSDAEKLTESLLNFNLRSPLLSSSSAAADSIREFFSELKGALFFRLTAGASPNFHGLPTQDPAFCGLTTDVEHGTGRHIIMLGIESIQPLLDDALTPAERITMQFRFASIVIHETAHAAWLYNQWEIPNPLTSVEPYFGDEVLPELGFSLEDKLWGGSAEDIVTAGYMQGGPGIPNMGMFKTSWFTDQHTGYMSGSLYLLDYAVPLPDGAIDTFYLNDYWPISTSWSHGLFQKDMWDSLVKGYGTKATEMGPTVWGNRVFMDDPLDVPARFMVGADLSASGTLLAISTASTPAQNAQIALENARRTQAIAIDDTVRSTRKLRSYQLPAIPIDDEDTVLSTNLNPNWDFSCPRWDEITTYLFANRGPLELALETMAFSIPEPTLYRYIRARGGLSLSYSEFRQFLRCADSRKLLFSYLPFPSSGTVRRIPFGWPTPYVPAAIPIMANVANMDKQTDVEDILRLSVVQNTLFSLYREFRDIDLMMLRGHVNWYLGAEKIVSESDWLLVMNALAIDGSLVTWGPKGVVRLLWPLSDTRRDEWRQNYPVVGIMDEIFREKEVEASFAEGMRI